MFLSEHVVRKQPELRTKSPQAREFYRQCLSVERGKRNAKKGNRASTR